MVGGENDWDENAPQKIVDESAEKPSGWLDEEPDMIADPDAVRPEDWDHEMDGDWEPALINNLACAAAPGCGPWSRPMIENPAYKVVSWPIIFQSYLIYNLYPDFRFRPKEDGRSTGRRRGGGGGGRERGRW